MASFTVPFTTHEVLAQLRAAPLRGKRVVVQRYGESNRELEATLESEGVEVVELGRKELLLKDP